MYAIFVLVFVILELLIFFTDTIDAQKIEKMKKQKRLALAPVHQVQYYSQGIIYGIVVIICLFNYSEISQGVFLILLFFGFFIAGWQLWLYQQLNFDEIRIKCDKAKFVKACQKLISERKLYDTFLNDDDVFQGFRPRYFCSFTASEMITIIRLEEKILFKSISSPYQPPVFTYGNNNKNYQSFVKNL